MNLNCPQIAQINADFGCSTSNGFGVACVMGGCDEESLDCPQITQINADFGCSTSNGFGVACVMGGW